MRSRLLRRATFLTSGLTLRTSESAADRVEQAIYDACEFLAEGPLPGHRRPDLTPRPLRFWKLNRYPNDTIVYRPDTAPLQIIAILHGKRNLRRVLKGRP